MLSASTLPPPSALDHDTVALEAAPATEVSFDLSVESDVAPETMNTAHRAVEAVLTAVHRFSSKDHQAVNLQFTVGGSDLSVRVEMRADEVRATFTTDSAELRAALSHEWQSAQPPASDRPLKLAAPNFVSNDAANTGSSPGQNFSRQRDAGVHAGAEPFSLIAPRTRAARGAGFDTPSAVNAPRIPHRNSLHLHTLA